jgi:hypothetical protein
MDCKNNIIGFFHICQKPGWERSFDIIFDEMINSGLYDNTNEIHCVIVNDNGGIIEDDRLKKDKFKLIYGGDSNRYERSTLLYMREYSNNCEPSYFWYVHTKGMRWFGTEKEEPVIDWIVFMLYWNFKKWKRVVEFLNNYEVCGCNYRDGNDKHFSGNFWWARSDYIKRQPLEIGDNYYDPEFWLFKANPTYMEMCNCRYINYEQTCKKEFYADE